MDNYEVHIKNLINNYVPLLFSNPYVTGVGRGTKVINKHRTNIPCLCIHVKKKIPKAMLSKEQLIPNIIHGAVTDIVEMGECKPLNNHFELDLSRDNIIEKYGNKNPPLMSGDEIKAYCPEFGIFASTLGYLVTDRKTEKEFYILTCAHSLSYNDELCQGILQKGIDPSKPVFIAKPTKVVKRVKKKFEDEAANNLNLNSVDGGIAKINNSNNTTKGKLVVPISNIGYSVTGTAKATLGMAIEKSGGSSNLTEGIITELDVSISTKYYWYKNMIIAQQLAYEGDSGALGIIQSKGEKKAFGMLSSGIKHTNSVIYCPIDTVLEELDIKFVITKK